MKRNLYLFLLLLCGDPLGAQSIFAPDTILIQTFELDPSDEMLPFPGGNDTQWVNWDADNQATYCERNGQSVPGNWYWESDLGDPGDPPVNSAFTSCSFLASPFVRNENWLIAPPVFIPDSTTVLFWRSLTYEGPGYMDGYKVLVSTTTNEPFNGSFTDTLFVAAEMDSAKVFAPSLDLNDYVFSPGYIHADGFTDTAYYYWPDPQEKIYYGRLEPHEVSLARYKNQTIYIAFLHDSKDDNTLQIDDITVIHGKTLSTPSPAGNLSFQLQPNPAHGYFSISGIPENVSDIWLALTDVLGRAVLEKRFTNPDNAALRVDVSGLPAGLYHCILRTNTGEVTQLLVKQ